MGREIRRVPVDFQHPIVWRERFNHPLFGDDGPRTLWKHELQPMYDRPLSEAQAEWDRGLAEWPESRSAQAVYDVDDLVRAEERIANPFMGMRSSQGERDYIEHVQAHLGERVYASYEEYAGVRPGSDEEAARYYQPEGWPEPEQRGYVVYETVSEGTPITPTFAAQDELIDWLCAKGTAWDAPMSREGAEHFVRDSGYVPSMITIPAGMRTGLQIAERSRTADAGHPDPVAAADARQGEEMAE